MATTLEAAIERARRLVAQYEAGLVVVRETPDAGNAYPEPERTGGRTARRRRRRSR